MTEEELTALVDSITPERLRELAATDRGRRRVRGGTSVPVMGLVSSLLRGKNTGEVSERKQALVRVHDAVVATIGQMPDATHVPGT